MGAAANTPGAPLVAQINAAHRAVCGNALKAVEYAAECGRLLIKAKLGVRHGKWGAWVKANTEVSERLAQSYMQIAKGWDQIKAKTQTSAVLSIDGALKLIAKKPKAETDEQARREERVKERIAAREAKADRDQLLKNDHQVKEFLDAIKTHEEKLAVAAKSLCKFSPEAKAFAARRLDKVAAMQAELKNSMVPPPAVIEPDGSTEPDNDWDRDGDDPDAMPPENYVSGFLFNANGGAVMGRRCAAILGLREASVKRRTQKYRDDTAEMEAAALAALRAWQEAYRALPAEVVTVQAEDIEVEDVPTPPITGHPECG
jgi:hypothetical protein